MKLWIVVVALIVVLGALSVFALGQAGELQGRRPTDLGVRDGRLKPPSSTRNSVSSQAGLYTGSGAEYARIAPLAFQGSSDEAMQRLRKIVTSMPGARIIESRPDYLYAQFTSHWLKFIDDVEFAILPGAQALEVRAATRLGSEDFGVNRARTEPVRARDDAH
jgi:uncharacterized protein (DUF1499 family)